MHKVNHMCILYPFATLINMLLAGVWGGVCSILPLCGLTPCAWYLLSKSFSGHFNVCSSGVLNIYWSFFEFQRFFLTNRVDTVNLKSNKSVKVTKYSSQINIIWLIQSNDIEEILLKANKLNPKVAIKGIPFRCSGEK